MNHNLKYGLYLGFISVAFSAALFAIDYRLTQETFLSLVPTIITVAILIIAGRDLRTQQDGYLSFREAFLSSFVIYMIGAAISTLYLIVQYNIFAPEIAGVLREEAVNQAAKVLESIGADDQTIDQAVLEAENTNPFGVSSQLIALGFQAILGAIVAAIIGAIVKKDKPEFE